MVLLQNESIFMIMILRAAIAALHVNVKINQLRFVVIQMAFRIFLRKSERQMV